MKNQKKHLLFLFLTLLGISYFTWITLNAGRRLEKTTAWIVHSHEVINNISNISTTISEIHSDFMGWLTVDKDFFAAEIKKSETILPEQIENTRLLTADNAVQQVNIARIKILSEELVKWHNAYIQSQVQPAIDPMFPGLKSRLLMGSIKKGLTEMSLNEEELLRLRILANDKASDIRRLFTIAGGISYLIFAFTIFLKMRRSAIRRKQSELSLFQSEIKYRRLIEDAGVVMFTTNLTGDFTFVNLRIESLTGYKDTEVINRNFSFLVEPSYLSLLENHYHNQFVKRLPQATIEFPIITNTGEERWIEQDSVLIYEKERIIGFQCIVREIHLRKKAEAALQKIETERKEYEYRLQSILDNTPLMIFIKDLEGKYILVNKRFKESFRGDQSLIGKTDYNFDTRENADRYKESDEKVKQTLKPLEQEEVIVNEGKIQNLMIVKFPLFDQSRKIFGICGIATDTTERMQYHKHLLETRRNAEKAEQMQGEFLANMSHEIRTPMNGIVGMTNLLLHTQLNAEQEGFLHIIRQSSDNLLFLINDVLDLSKIKAGKMTIESIEFNITNVMETVIAPFRIKLKERGVELITDIDPGIPEMLVGDPYRLSQILSNLFSNAIKFTAKGYIKFKVFRTGDADCTLIFSVEDTGIGIAEDKINDIFESFTQASMDTTRKFGGTGLGLSITRQLIQLQDGTLNVTSTVGKGSIFQFMIPYKHVSATLTQAVNQKQVIDKEVLRGKKILIVEDNEINQMVISFTLKQAGMFTTIVGNGREAVDLLETGDNTDYDLIIMDLQMPVMDGFEASFYIRRELKLQIPIIAMTASVLRDERIRCFDAGMNDYMSKPFKPAELFETIYRFLNENTKKTRLKTQT